MARTSTGVEIALSYASVNMMSTINSTCTHA